MANFYWRTSSTALSSIPDIASGDKAVVLDSSGIVSFWSYDGADWNQSGVSFGEEEWGFNGVTPSVTQTNWTTINVTTDRVLDANSTTLDEVADVLCTVIEDLKTKGIFSS